MEISVSEAKTHLTDLVRRAAAGDEVILTRHGQAIVRLVPVAAKPNRERRRDVMTRIMEVARDRGPDNGADAARSQDFLYDDSGLPE